MFSSCLGWPMSVGCLWYTCRLTYFPLSRLFNLLPSHCYGWMVFANNGLMSSFEMRTLIFLYVLLCHLHFFRLSSENIFFSVISWVCSICTFIQYICIYMYYVHWLEYLNDAQPRGSLWAFYASLLAILLAMLMLCLIKMSSYPLKKV